MPRSFRGPGWPVPQCGPRHRPAIRLRSWRCRAVPGFNLNFRPDLRLRLNIPGRCRGARSAFASAPWPKRISGGEQRSRVHVGFNIGFQRSHCKFVTFSGSNMQIRNCLGLCRPPGRLQESVVTPDQRGLIGSRDRTTAGA